MTDYSDKEMLRIWRDVEISPHWLWPFALAPFFMPVLAVAAFGIGLAIGIAIGAGGGGAAGGQGGGGGALFGLVVGGALGVTAAMAIYLFLPLISYLCVVFVYLMLGGYQEVTGRRMYVTVKGWRMSLKSAVIVSFMSVGVISILFYYAAWAVFGMSPQNFYTASTGFEFAWGNYWSLYLEASSQIKTEISLHGVLGVVVVFTAVLWALFIYVGLNYYLSRSLSYCFGVYVTAFFLDITFTIACYVLGTNRRFEYNDFFLRVNDVDDWLRATVMSPVHMFFGLFEDFDMLLKSLSQLFSAISGFIYAMVEAGLGAVLLEDGALKRAVYNAIEFARFLEVDFLFFVISTCIWATRLKMATPS